jgi:hypothetical protein
MSGVMYDYRHVLYYIATMLTILVVLVALRIWHIG